MYKPIARFVILAGVVSGAYAGTHVLARVQTAPALVKTAPAHILVNAQGMTLYVYTLDKHNKSLCTGVCATYWPPVLLPGGTSVAALPNMGGTFGVATRSGGKRQLTFDGAPLYTFVGDKKPGDIKGQGAVGGTWWVVVTSASAASASAGATPPAATPTPAPTTSSGGGGYGGGGYGGGGY